MKLLSRAAACFVTGATAWAAPSPRIATSNVLPGGSAFRNGVVKTSEMARPAQRVLLRSSRESPLGGRAGHKLVPPSVGSQRHKVMAGSHGEGVGERWPRLSEQAAARFAPRVQGRSPNPSHRFPGGEATLGGSRRSRRANQKAGVPQNRQNPTAAGRVASRDDWGSGIRWGVFGRGTPRVKRTGRETPAFRTPPTAEPPRAATGTRHTAGPASSRH